MMDRTTFEEIRADWNENGLPAIMAGLPDRTDLMVPLEMAIHVDKEKLIPDKRVFQAVLKVYGVEPYEIMNKSREPVATEARTMCMYTMARYGSGVLAEIGRFLNRDHTTIMHARDSFEEKLRRPEMRQRYLRVLREIGVFER